MCCVTSHLYSTVLISAFRILLCSYNLCSTLGYLRLILGNLAAFTHGSCVVYPSEIFDPTKIVDALSAEKCVGAVTPCPPGQRDSSPANRMNFVLVFSRCTALHGVPTHFLGVLSELKNRRNGGEAVDLSRLRTGIASGSPVPIDLMKQLIDQMNLTELTVAYGMS